MKIESKQDLVKKRKRRFGPDDIADELVETADSEFMRDLMTEAKKTRSIVASDGAATDDILRQNLEMAGVLKFRKGEVAPQDMRIGAREEQRLQEFAQQVSKGRPGVVVEFADSGWRVYGKEAEVEGVRHLVEFGEYPRPEEKTKRRV